MTAEFVIEKSLLNTIIAETAGVKKYLQKFVVDVKDERGKLVAKVAKTIYITKKQ